MKKRTITKLAILTLMAMMISTCRGLHTTAAETNETWISSDIQLIVEDVSEMYGVCPELIVAIIEKESSGQVDAVNGDCKGLMQISERWHEERMERLGVTDLFVPYGNVLVGVDYLMELAEEHDDLYTVLMIYNGTSNAIERGESGDYTEYARHIVERSAELERLKENQANSDKAYYCKKDYLLRNT